MDETLLELQGFNDRDESWLDITTFLDEMLVGETEFIYIC